MNKFIGVGVLGTDPEIINKGCSINIALNNRTNKKTVWVKVLAFGTLSATVLEYKKSGDRIYIDGSLETTPTGKLVIVAKEIDFL